MQKVPLRPCAAPGCPRYAEVGSAYCAECGRARRRPDPRPSAARRGYDSRWRRLRRMVLAEQPLCRRCLERGEVRLAEHVHHLRPLVAGGTHERDNLMPLCRKCHAEVHRREGEGDTEIFEVCV